MPLQCHQAGWCSGKVLDFYLEVYGLNIGWNTSYSHDFHDFPQFLQANDAIIAPFQILSKSLFTTHPSIQCYIICDTDSTIK
jgi:hypothetical protein